MTWWMCRRRTVRGRSAVTLDLYRRLIVAQPNLHRGSRSAHRAPVDGGQVPEDVGELHRRHRPPAALHRGPEVPHGLEHAALATAVGAGEHGAPADGDVDPRKGLVAFESQSRSGHPPALYGARPRRAIVRRPREGPASRGAPAAGPSRRPAGTAALGPLPLAKAPRGGRAPTAGPSRRPREGGEGPHCPGLAKPRACGPHSRPSPPEGQARGEGWGTRRVGGRRGYVGADASGAAGALGAATTGSPVSLSTSCTAARRV